MSFPFIFIIISFISIPADSAGELGLTSITFKVPFSDSVTVIPIPLTEPLESSISASYSSGVIYAEYLSLRPETIPLSAASVMASLSTSS